MNNEKLKGTKCPSCGSKETTGRVVEDDYGHEDERWICNGCGEQWWYEGIDS